LKQEKKATAWYPDRTGRETTRAITGADGLPVIQNIETIRTFSWGDGVTRRITDPAGACLTNTFTYTAAGLTESAVEPDGSWRYYRPPASSQCNTGYWLAGRAFFMCRTGVV
jgi:hypothetical protein